MALEKNGFQQGAVSTSGSSQVTAPSAITSIEEGNEEDETDDSAPTAAVRKASLLPTYSDKDEPLPGENLEVVADENVQMQERARIEFGALSHFNQRTTPTPGPVDRRSGVKKLRSSFGGSFSGGADFTAAASAASASLLDDALGLGNNSPKNFGAERIPSHGSMVNNTTLSADYFTPESLNDRMKLYAQQ
eukprot:gene37077-45739_t